MKLKQELNSKNLVEIITYLNNVYEDLKLKKESKIKLLFVKSLIKDLIEKLTLLVVKRISKQTELHNIKLKNMEKTNETNI